jgi:hypothetical protein
MRRRSGCLLAASILALGLFLFIASFGLVRTSAMESPEASTDAFTLKIESASGPHSSQGAWPVTDQDVYADDGQLRGTLKPRSQSAKVENLKLIISSPSSPGRIVRCLSGYPDTCYFTADLRPARLEQGVVVSVLDTRTGKPVSPPVSFSFQRHVSYASTWWEVLMSV